VYQLYTAKGLHKQSVLTKTQYDILFLQAVLRYSCSSGWFDCALCNCCTLCDLVWKLEDVRRSTETCLWIVIYDETHFADVHLVVNYVL